MYNENHISGEMMMHRKNAAMPWRAEAISL